MRIAIDDLSGTAIHALLSEHLANMYELSPPEQVFALDLSKLKSPDITFWTVWEGDQLLGCGALKELTSTVSDVLPWSTWPIVPMLQCGLSRRNFSLAMVSNILFLNLYLACQT